MPIAWLDKLFRRTDPLDAAAVAAAAAVASAATPPATATTPPPTVAGSPAKRFFAAFVDPLGSPIALPDIGDCWPMTIEDVQRVKQAPDFIEQLSAGDHDYSRSLMIDGEFDILPLIIHWMPEDETSGLAVFQSFAMGGSGSPHDTAPCMAWLTATSEPAGDGPANIFEGMWEIESFAEVLGRYRERPLALIVTASPPGSEPLSAAALSFAGAYHLLGLGKPKLLRAQD